MRLRNCLLLLALLAPGLQGRAQQAATPILYSGELRPSQDDAAIHRRFKPLERPRAGFRIEHAAYANDSLWVVVRITIPHRTIRRGENLEADFVLHTEEVMKELNTIQLYDEHLTGTAVVNPSPPDGATQQLATSPRHIRYLFYSSKFPYDDRLAERVWIDVSTSIRSKKYLYEYQTVTLPLQWSEGFSVWQGADAVREEDLLIHNPHP